MKPTRLFFLDAVRAFAILMMLQGHFIDSLLKPIYRDKSNAIYNTWEYFRGITAPTFFTITGLVFVYLLLRAKSKNEDAYRIKKGFNRGLLLIGIGYALRFSFIELFQGKLNLYFIVIDVLQCIGLSLILLIGLYLFTLKKEYIFAVLMLVLGTTIFATEPLYRTLHVEGIPKFLANYITKENGSVFTMIPWFGYVCYGAFIAVLFHKFGHKYRYKQIKITGFLVFGVGLMFLSSPVLNYLTTVTGIQLFYDSAHYNYLFTRLGNVLVIFGLFYTFERFLKHAIITKIGQKTLSIYVIHFIIIYGSFTGIGLKHFFYKSLTPMQAILGALVFMIVVCMISFHYAKTNKFIYKWMRKAYERITRK